MQNYSKNGVAMELNVQIKWNRLTKNFHSTLALKSSSHSQIERNQSRSKMARYFQPLANECIIIVMKLFVADTLTHSHSYSNRTEWSRIATIFTSNAHSTHTHTHTHTVTSRPNTIFLFIKPLSLGNHAISFVHVCMRFAPRIIRIVVSVISLPFRVSVRIGVIVFMSSSNKCAHIPYCRTLHHHTALMQHSLNVWFSSSSISLALTRRQAHTHTHLFASPPRKQNANVAAAYKPKFFRSETLGYIHTAQQRHTIQKAKNLEKLTQRNWIFVY